MPSDKGLIFLHIPKTAGTTLRAIVHRQHPARDIFYVDNPDDIARFHLLPADTRRSFRVIQGHVPYGFHEHLAVPVDYITLLRDPVRLVVSMYHFFVHKRFPRLRTWVEGRSLNEFVSSELRLVHNLQTRQLSGLVEENTRAALETARLNLSHHIAAFGLDTRFDESLILFKRRLGWRNVFYMPLNVNRSRTHVEDVPRSTISLIEKNNALDLELYEFARRTFDETIERQDHTYWKELHTFRRLNPVCGRLNEAYRRARATVPRGVRDFVTNRRNAHRLPDER